MSIRLFFLLAIGILGLLCGAPACAQDSAGTDPGQAGERYLHGRVAALSRYAARAEARQERLLRRLAAREKRLLGRLRRVDSVAAARLQAGVSFDSLRRRTGVTGAGLRATDASVDSLRRVERFLAARTGAAAAGRLPALQDRLSRRACTDQAIQTRLRELRTRAAGAVPGLQGLEKTAYYTNTRLKAWRVVANDPSAAEDRALELLQGTEGFSEALAAETGMPAGAAGPASAAELEKLGYQTRRQVQAGLQQHLGDRLAPVQQALGAQVADWQQHLGVARAAAGKAQVAARDLRATAAGAQQTAAGAWGLGRPAFHVNPMRGMPLYQRLERCYTLNGCRASAGRPAVLDGGIQVAFRHTPSLSYGVGAMATAGLGQDWNRIRLSAEGLGARAFAQWKGPYGFGGYAGYERSYRLALLSQVAEADIPPATRHRNEHWSESMLLGVTKSYRINARWSGAVQVLFDVWWREKNAPSPFVLRFVSNSNP